MLGLMGLVILTTERIKLNDFLYGQLASVTVVTSKQVINKVYIDLSTARVNLNSSLNSNSILALNKILFELQVSATPAMTNLSKSNLSCSLVLMSLMV